MTSNQNRESTPASSEVKKEEIITQRVGKQEQTKIEEPNRHVSGTDRNCGELTGKD